MASPATLTVEVKPLRAAGAAMLGIAAVRPLVGGPGENPMVKTFRPLISSTWSALTVTSELVWASNVEEAVEARRSARQRAWSPQ